MDSELNSLIHHPLRLRIVSYLSRVGQSDYGRLLELLQIDSPELSRQLKTLSKAGLVHLFKRSPNGKTQSASLSVSGEREFKRYKKALRQVILG